MSLLYFDFYEIVRNVKSLSKKSMLGVSKYLYDKFLSLPIEEGELIILGLSHNIEENFETALEFSHEAAKKIIYLESHDNVNKVKRTLKEIFSKLVVFSKISGKGSQEKKQKYLRDILFEGLSPEEQKSIVEIFFLKARVGISHHGLENLIEKFNNNQYTKYCFEAHLSKRYRAYRLNEKEYVFSRGVPIVLAKCLSQKIEKAERPFLLEPKYDGLRIQIHKNKLGEIISYSRNNKRLLEFREISSFFENNTKSFIVEGELVAYCYNTNSIKQFNELIFRKGVKDRGSLSNLIDIKLLLFDCLYYGDQELAAFPLRERKKVLISNFIGRNLECIEGELILDKSTFHSKVESLKSFSEGVVLKNYEREYLTKRSTEGWRKIRFDFLEEKMIIIDALVIGYKKGKGKREKTLGALLVGVHNSRGELIPLTYVGTGLTEEILEKLYDTLVPLETKSRYKKYPNVIVVSPSVMIEIGAPSLTIKNNEFSCKFRIFRALRRDKGLHETTRYEDIAEQYHIINRKNNKKMKYENN